MFNRPPWEGSQGPSCSTVRLQFMYSPRFCPHPPRTCLLGQAMAHLAYNRRFDTHRSSLAHVVSGTLVGWIAPAQDRLVGASASDSGQLCDQPSPPTTSTSDDFCVFPTPMRAACTQVWLVPTSTRALRPLERAVAARQVAARHRRPRAAVAKSRFLRFCRVCQSPCSSWRLQDCKVSTFGRGPTPPGPSAGAACRAAAQHGRQFSAVAVAIFRAWLCSAENRPLYIQI
eukprot:scaffold107568_cov77-Phaeocystis_antarctica.AAC.7